MPWRYSLRLAYAALGAICLLLAIIGILIPILPTTPFVLLAAFFFSRSSRRLHNWILRQPILGPIIEDWERDRAVSTKAKWMAGIMITASLSVSVVFAPMPIWLTIPLALAGVAVLIFIVSRPTPEQAARRRGKAMAAAEAPR